MENNLETIVFGGGCFWCTEAIFQRVPGVIKVTSGYSGGDTENPTYEEVSEGDSGHVEVVKVDYDKSITHFEKLLQIFFATHDPTSINKQGNDEGEQYKSVIFYTNEDQKYKSIRLIENLEESDHYQKPIVTEVVRLEKFYEAEDYHKNYYNNHKEAPYCKIVIEPKLNKFI